MTDFSRVLLICILSNFILAAQTTDKVITSDQLKRQVYFNPHKSGKVNETMRNEWIRKTVDSLISIDSVEYIDVLSPHVIDLDEYEMTSYRVNGKGKLVFTNGEYFIVYVHSAHEDPEIGDVSVALSMNKNVYVNYGHVCGGIIHFISMSNVIPVKPADFFSLFISDTDDEKWILWKSE